jgi:hypothetical protein
MGVTLRIDDEVCEEVFTLVGIHTSMEDHALVYALNDCLRIRLRRAKNDLSFTKMTSYPYFEWKDELYDRTWTLLFNTCVIEAPNNPDNLFPNELSYTTHSLLPEYKEVDYLLKIDDEDPDTEVLKKIKSLPRVITAYMIDAEKLKSKPNLIF